MADKKIVGFKRFSDLKSKSKVEEIQPSIQPETDSNRPMNPNLPQNSGKVEKPASTDNITNKQEVKEEESVSEGNVETIGKIAKFPKNVKASKAFNFLENVKVSRKSIWYIMVEKQNDELQMVKYNVKEGVNLGHFVNELKEYYLSKYSNDVKVCEMINQIKFDGNDKFSMIKNIPLVTVDGRKMITIITEDLIKLLSK
jgi:hypothetical protein